MLRDHVGASGRALCLSIDPGLPLLPPLVVLRGPYLVLGIEPRPTVRKASALSAVLSIWPTNNHFLFFILHSPSRCGSKIKGEKKQVNKFKAGAEDRQDNTLQRSVPGSHTAGKSLPPPSQLPVHTSCQNLRACKSVHSGRQGAGLLA